jgi:hypothetical protein
MSALYKQIRSLIVRNLADYSTTQTPPKSNKGYFAYLLDNGKVWLGESKALANLHKQYHHQNASAVSHTVAEYVAKGHKLSMFISTKMTEEQYDYLRAELDSLDVLLTRKEKNKEWTGQLFRFTHDTTGYYFLTSSRVEGDHQFRGLSRFMYLLNNYKSSSGTSANIKLDEFVSRYAGDVLRQQGFTATVVGTFDNKEDLDFKFREHIDLHGAMFCLNRSA